MQNNVCEYDNKFVELIDFSYELVCIVLHLNTGFIVTIQWDVQYSNKGRWGVTGEQ